MCSKLFGNDDSTVLTLAQLKEALLRVGDIWTAFRLRYHEQLKVPMAESRELRRPQKGGHAPHKCYPPERRQQSRPGEVRWRRTAPKFQRPPYEQRNLVLLTGGASTRRCGHLHCSTAMRRRSQEKSSGGGTSTSLKHLNFYQTMRATTTTTSWGR